MSQQLYAKIRHHDQRNIKKQINKKTFHIPQSKMSMININVHESTVRTILNGLYSYGALLVSLITQSTLGQSHSSVTMRIWKYNWS